MKIFLCFLIAILLYLSVPPYVASYQAPEAPKPSVQELIALNASKYQVSPKTLQRVISCESSGNINAIGDGGKSYGLVQIFLPMHPDISKANALDPSFAVNFLAEQISLGHGRLWTCYRNM